MSTLHLIGLVAIVLSCSVVCGWSVLRFIRVLREHDAADPETLDGLQRLVISGTGDNAKIWRATFYLLLLKYRNTGVREVTRAGDVVLLLSVLSVALLVILFA
ncbi:hypothetical protein BWI17_07990 [Betaproteobacteria bacterium GR16-43]|nr:hypothetical protein BWI17_07990 [Betaproteobacteria bacterium GR16-43]